VLSARYLPCAQRGERIATCPNAMLATPASIDAVSATTADAQ